jgi:hypothetical protein
MSLIGLVKKVKFYITVEKIQITSATVTAYNKAPEDVELIEAELQVSQGFGANALLDLRNKNGDVIIKSKYLIANTVISSRKHLDISYIFETAADQIDCHFTNASGGSANLFLTIRRKLL